MAEKLERVTLNELGGRTVQSLELLRATFGTHLDVELAGQHQQLTVPRLDVLQLACDDAAVDRARKQRGCETTCAVLNDSCGLVLLRTAPDVVDAVAFDLGEGHVRCWLSQLSTLRQLPVALQSVGKQVSLVMVPHTRAAQTMLELSARASPLPFKRWAQVMAGATQGVLSGALYERLQPIGQVPRRVRVHWLTDDQRVAQMREWGHGSSVVH